MAPLLCTRPGPTAGPASTSRHSILEGSGQTVALSYAKLAAQLRYGLLAFRFQPCTAQAQRPFARCHRAARPVEPNHCARTYWTGTGLQFGVQEEHPLLCDITKALAGRSANPSPQLLCIFTPVESEIPLAGGGIVRSSALCLGLAREPVSIRVVHKPRDQADAAAHDAVIESRDGIPLAGPHAHLRRVRRPYQSPRP